MGYSRRDSLSLKSAELPEDPALGPGIGGVSPARTGLRVGRERGSARQRRRALAVATATRESRKPSFQVVLRAAPSASRG